MEAVYHLKTITTRTTSELQTSEQTGPDFTDRVGLVAIVGKSDVKLNHNGGKYKEYFTLMSFPLSKRC